MLKARLFLVFCCLVVYAPTTFGAKMILNEYNAVADSNYLNAGDANSDQDGGYASDSYFGRVQGNGGDWFELVVIQDHLDIRRWKLDIFVNGAFDETLRLTNHPIWSDLRSGTIITVSEDLSDDVSYDPVYDPYDPEAGDWWINVQARIGASGQYIEATNFPVNNNDWQLRIKTLANVIIFGRCGEGIVPGVKVSDIEIFRLEADPNASITPDSTNYDDGKTLSTFGSANRWPGGNVQDFSQLRKIAPVRYGGGSGTAEDPYLIYTPQQMSTIGLCPAHWDKHFKLTADIDMSEFMGTAFNIIGISDSNAFRGVFDGNGRTISNFTYSSSGANYIAIFGYVNDPNAEIINLGVVSPNISAGTGACVGSLVGVMDEGIISKCYAQGGIVSGTTRVGGLVGDSGGTISNCYSTSSVSGNSGVGGIAGWSFDGMIYNCYSAGSVSGTMDTGGLVGFDSGGTYNKSFWDNTVNPLLTGIGNITDPADVIGESTANMQTENTYIAAGWDFIGERDNGIDNIWRLCSVGTDYPELAWRFLLPDFTCPDGVDIYDLAVFTEQWLWQVLSANIVTGGPAEVVNFSDWAVFAAAWQSTPSSPNWNEKCDIAPEDGDGIVDMYDLLIFIEQWMQLSAYCADIAPDGGDGLVNMLDFVVFANNWLAGP